VIFFRVTNLIFEAFSAVVLYYFMIARTVNYMSTSLTSPQSVRIIGTNGQISLGKQFAGRQVLVEEQEPGVWLIRTATVIPDNERWLHNNQAANDLSSALAWAQKNIASDAAIHDVLAKLND
jgi:hypothetical protein